MKKIGNYISFISSSIILSIVFNVCLWTLLCLLIEVFNLKETLWFPFSIKDGFFLGIIMGIVKFEVARTKKKNENK